MVLAVREENLHDIINLLEKDGEKVFIIGRTTSGEGVTFGGGNLE